MTCLTPSGASLQRGRPCRLEPRPRSELSCGAAAPGPCAELQPIKETVGHRLGSTAIQKTALWPQRCGPFILRRLNQSHPLALLDFASVCFRPKADIAHHREGMPAFGLRDWSVKRPLWALFEHGRKWPLADGLLRVAKWGWRTFV